MRGISIILGHFILGVHFTFDVESDACCYYRLLIIMRSLVHVGMKLNLNISDMNRRLIYITIYHN